jgi:hypothetical protein
MAEEKDEHPYVKDGSVESKKGAHGLNRCLCKDESKLCALHGSLRLNGTTGPAETMRLITLALLSTFGQLRRTTAIDAASHIYRDVKLRGDVNKKEGQ